MKKKDIKSKKLISQSKRDRLRKQVKEELEEDGYVCSCCERTLEMLDALEVCEKQLMHPLLNR